MSIRFECVPTKCIFDGENFKIYACDIDTKKYKDIKLNGYGNVTICGDIGNISLLNQYTVEATEKTSKYGISYLVEYIKCDVAMTKEGLKEFLIGCGLSESQTQEICREYPDIINLVRQGRTNEINTDKLYNIGSYRMSVIINRIEENFLLADAISQLGGYFSFNIIKKLFEHYHSIEKIIEQLEKNPYQSLVCINRIGFKTADMILLGVEDKINKTINKFSKCLEELD